MSHAEENRTEQGHYVKSEVTQTKQKWSHDDDRQTWDTTKDKDLLYNPTHVLYKKKKHTHFNI
jgi:hypothetical protein